MTEQTQHRRFLEQFLPVQDLVMGYLVVSIRNRTEAEDLFQGGIRRIVGEIRRF